MMAPTAVKFGSVSSELGPAGVRGFVDVTTEWLRVYKGVLAAMLASSQYGHWR
jgi:hypothetical protein